jgi:hypothetical protein
LNKIYNANRLIYVENPPKKNRPSPVREKIIRNKSKNNNASEQIDLIYKSDAGTNEHNKVSLSEIKSHIIRKQNASET